MIRRTLVTSVRYTRKFAAAATRPSANIAQKVSKVNGATGADGDSIVDKLFVLGCVSAVSGWAVFGPAVQSHH
ncbi:hypothetical protein DPX39_060054700 [Trypanosoma brucei equiperdum]|uniref:Uncharacterized protein n=1 Tax=Trypanosoma brucei equiperdum TaxID=630700 RepID=A0A3L6L797_9TRYP|nr:hypothetical protein DPX39_060054700 [Trypanosoma brucei equiperdum]